MTYYFAYGSNMNSARIAARLPCVRKVGVGYICGWKLVERLYADITPQPRQRVWGVLYLLTESQLWTLDRYEGYPRIYRDTEVIVHIAGRTIRALTYLMTVEAKVKRDGKPYPEPYRIICSDGATQNGIPDGFSTTTTRRSK